MAHISDYSQDAIANRTGKDVKNWYCIEKTNGMTEIQYELVNRQEAMGVGGAVGGLLSAVTTGGLVVATCINPVFAPLLAVNSTAGSIGSVLVGMGVGYAAGAIDKYHKYFCTHTGEFIGDTTNDAAKNAILKGEALLKQSDFTNAKEWFRIVSGISDKHEFKLALQAIEKAELAEYCYKKGYLNDVIAHYKEACELVPACIKYIFEQRFEQVKDLTNQAKIKAEAARKEAEAARKEAAKIKAEAARLFQDAITNWNLAWKKEEKAEVHECARPVSEEQDEVKETARLFQTAYEKCKNALEACSSNEEYLNWLHVISLKIEGNSLFNEGYSWQDRANQSYSQELYEEALKYYNLALEKYTEGLHKSEDRRFEDCINIVQRQISTTQQAIGHICTDKYHNEQDKKDTFLSFFVEYKH